MVKRHLLIVGCFSFLFYILVANQLYGQTTNIPDPNFEQFLIDQGFDTNGLTGNILDTDAAAVTDLNVNVTDITDFTGLEAFVNLVTLNAGTNQFPTLPLNTLTALEELQFRNNQALASLNLSQNTALRVFEIRASSAAPIPTISSLDFSQNLSLEKLDVSVFASITSLTLPVTATLTDIDVAQLSVPDIDLSLLEGDIDFRIVGSRVDVNIIYPNKKDALKDLELSSINFPTVDVSEMIGLETFGLSSTNVESFQLPATNSLTRITISGHRINVPIDMSIVPQLSNLVIMSNWGTVPLDVNVASNLALTNLSLTSNLMNNVNITQNTNLTSVDLSRNNFTNIDITQNTKLTSFSATNNVLPSIDLSQNLELNSVRLSFNQLPSLDITVNDQLRTLDIGNNLFSGTGLDLTQNPILSQLLVNNNQIVSLDITQNSELRSLNISFNLFPGNDILAQFADIIRAQGRLSGALIANNNFLSGPVPDFFALYDPMVQTRRFQLWINENNFHFGDFEDQHLGLVGLTTTMSIGPSPDVVIRDYNYAPQQKVNAIENLNRNAGDDITLTTIVRGTQNHYQWFKDGVAIAGAPDSPELIIENIESCDAGVYHCEITSDLVPFENGNPPGTDGKNLLLIRNDITLTVNTTKSCVNLSSPINGATNIPINTNITWNEAVGACSYLITMGTTSGGNDIANNEEVEEGTIFTISPDLPSNTEIFVTITPVYDDGSFGGCSEESFTTSAIVASLSCTNLTAPTDGQTDVSKNSGLSWGAVEAADGYRLTLGTTLGGNDLLDDFDNGSLLTYQPNPALPEGQTIYVAIRPYNDIEGTINCHEESFTTEVVIVAPSCTTLTLPADGATNVAIDTDLEWGAVTGATGYRLDVGTTSGGTDVLDNEDAGNVTSFDLTSDLDGNQTYFVTVTPYNSAGNATGCMETSFTTEVIIVAPSCTTLTLPVDGATNVTIDTDLEWDAVTGATGYRLDVGTTSGGTDILDKEDAGNVTSFDLTSDLGGNQTYFVTITPYNSAGNATGCTETSFTTEVIIVPPSCTALTLPADGATNVAIDTDLEWGAVTGATGYRLDVGTTSGGTDVLDNEDAGNVTSFDLTSDLDGNQTYFVTVTPYNSAGNATGCMETSFTTEVIIVAPSCTTLTLPVDGATNVTIDTDLEWDAVTGATGYRLDVGTTSGGTDILDKEDAGNVTSFDLTSDLGGNQTYFVTITPYNSAGNATGCMETSFTTEVIIVAPSCTTLTLPVDRATNVTIDTDLEWGAVTGATGYRLDVGTTSGGTDVLDNEDAGNVTSFDLTSDLDGNQTYFVTVTPYNSAGNATGCTETSFTTEVIIVPPSCTALTLPADGATNVAIDTDLEWGAVTGATGYRLDVGTTSGGTDVLDNEDAGNVTSFDLTSDLDGNQTYFVTVTPYNSAGNATGCTETSFTTEVVIVAPSCTTLTLPADGATNVAIDTDLEWSAVTGATGYRLDVGTTSGGTDILDNEDAGNVTSFDLTSDLGGNQTYFVTVTPYNSAGNATGCTETSFTTEVVITAPNCTNLIFPMQGSVGVDVNTSIQWEEVIGAIGYLLSVGTSTGGVDILDSNDVGNTNSFIFSNSLPSNTTIFITIIPYNDEMQAVDCTPGSFTTAVEEAGETKQGFSPDGDGINETWQIVDIENYPDNLVYIYNRWGDVVFEMSGYDNSSRVFKGIANRQTRLGAEQLPEGTYFFEIKIQGSHNLTKTKGYLVLKR